MSRDDLNRDDMNHTDKSEPIRSLIADDEPLARANVRALLEEWPRWSPPREAASGTQVMTELGRGEVDVVFLDVRMPGLDGLDVARRLQNLQRPPLIVFVTAFEQHAIDAFELDAVDYLLKPFEAHRFAKMLQRLQSRLDQRTEAAGGHHHASAQTTTGDEASGGLESLVVRSNKRFRFVATRDIIWIGAAGNYVRLYLENTCLLHRATLASLEGKLDPAHFLRVQRGAIINRRDIVEIRTPSAGRYVVLLRDGSEVDISQRYASRVLTRLGILSAG